jgi:hypothetical protein
MTIDVQFCWVIICYPLPESPFQKVQWISSALKVSLAVARSWIRMAAAKRWDRSLTIVALKRRGHVVGYPGDGVNDAPSFHSADVSISVET